MNPSSLYQIDQIRCYPESNSVFYSVDDICGICGIASSDLIQQIPKEQLEKKDPKTKTIYADGSSIVNALESISLMRQPSAESSSIPAIISMIHRDKELVESSSTKIVEKIEAMQQEILLMLTKTSTALLFDRQKSLDIYPGSK